jgi:hypothetical protein
MAGEVADDDEAVRDRGGCLHGLRAQDRPVDGHSTPLLGPDDAHVALDSPRLLAAGVVPLHGLHLLSRKQRLHLRNALLQRLEADGRHAGGAKRRIAGGNAEHGAALAEHVQGGRSVHRDRRVPGDDVGDAGAELYPVGRRSTGG